jgi:prepilin-type N-terminal cleavage/methylation domain-containing protein
MDLTSDMKANRELLWRTRSEEKGFTLMEVRVVVVIIGTLCAVALPAFLGLRTRGQDANTRSMESERKQLRSLKEDAPGVDQMDSQGHGDKGKPVVRRGRKAPGLP